MSIQTIINNAQFITFNAKKVIGQTISRSGRVKSAEVVTANPYRFIVGMHSGLKYSDNRALVQELTNLDRNVEEEINIGSTNSSLSYVTEYKGGITGGSLSMVGFDGDEIYINASLATGAGTLFKKGDFIQPQGNTSTYRYPYQVTSDVAFSTGANVTVPVHRAVISQTGVSLTSGGVDYGTDVTWKVIMLQKPSYSIVPHDRIEFDQDFDLLEVIL